MPLLSPSITTFQLFHKCNLELTANATEFSFLLLCMCSVTQLCPILGIPKSWTVACQAPLSMGFPRQEYRSGLSCPPPGDLPDPGIKPMSHASSALAGGFFTTSITWEAPCLYS